MIDLESSPKLRRQWLLVKLMYVMVLITSAIYLVICLLIAHLGFDGEFEGFVMQGDPAFFATVRIVLLVMSFPMVAAAFWVRALMKRGSVPAGMFPGVRVPATPEGAVIARLTQAMLVSMSFAETPGIFGLVTFFIMGGLGWLVAFLGISFAAKLFLMPSLTELQGMLEEERLRKDM